MFFKLTAVLRRHASEPEEMLGVQAGMTDVIICTSDRLLVEPNVLLLEWLGRLGGENEAWCIVDLRIGHAGRLL